MPETPQQKYSRELNANQNARLRRSDAAFHHQLPGQQAQLRVLYQQQQARQQVQVRAATPVNYMPSSWSLIFPVIAAALIARARRKSRRTTTRPVPSLMPRADPLPYHTVPSLLTPTEAHFYQTLCTAVGPLAVIQCKVRLADLLVAPRHDLTAFRRVSQKHVDFVLCERGSLKPLIAVELDDRSHEREDRRRRDQFVDAVYASAGLPLVHVQVQSVYNAAYLLAQLQPFLIVDVWGRD